MERSAKVGRSSDDIVRGMLGDLNHFFSNHWRQRPFYVPNAVPELAGAWTPDSFLQDYATYLPKPYLAISSHLGVRDYTQHDSIESLHAAIAAGGVATIKNSKLWHGAASERYAEIRDLFGALCRAVSMVYMSPARSEDVDLFFGGAHSCLGSHFDTSDVFTIQLFGSRKWRVEEVCDVEGILKIARSDGWLPTMQVMPRGKTCEFVLNPGDFLYIPSHVVHHVTGISWSVHLSFGVRSFNEIDFVEHLIDGIRRKGYLTYPPLPAFPESQNEAAVQAKLIGIQRIRALLAELESVALGAVLLPLSLPENFGPAGRAGLTFRPHEPMWDTELARSRSTS